LQKAIEETVIRMAAAAATCFAGGLGMNALLVRALNARAIARVFVQPACNAGTASPCCTPGTDLS
jgi:hypothetical protein